MKNYPEIQSAKNHIEINEIVNRHAEKNGINPKDFQHMSYAEMAEALEDDFYLEAEKAWFKLPG